MGSLDTEAKIPISSGEQVREVWVWLYGHTAGVHSGRDAGTSQLWYDTHNPIPHYPPNIGLFVMKSSI